MCACLPPKIISFLNCFTVFLAAKPHFNINIRPYVRKFETIRRKRDFYVAIHDIHLSVLKEENQIKIRMTTSTEA